MITLQSLTLAGFKSIKQTAPPLQFGPLTVMVGANGSGKSNLLSFFELLNALTSGSLRSYVRIQGGPESLLHYGLKHTPQMFATLEFSTETGVNTYHMTLTAAKGRVRTLLFTEESVDYRAHGMTPHMDPMSLGVGHEETGLLDPRMTGNSTVEFFKMALKGFRLYQFHDTSSEAPLRNYRFEVHKAIPFHGNGGNLPAVLFHMSTHFPESYHLLLKTIQLVSPFLKQFSFEREKGSAQEPDVILSWISEGQDYQMGMHQLSDGTLRFIALATLLLLPEGMMPKGAVLIDEPELGLHPKAIAVLAGLIRTASHRVQIICTTQSAELLSEFAPEEVLVADRSAGASVFKRVDTENLKVWLEDEFTLGDIWKKNLIGGRPHRE
jgi:predicted ATPase